MCAPCPKLCCVSHCVNRLLIMGKSHSQPNLSTRHQEGLWICFRSCHPHRVSSCLKCPCILVLFCFVLFCFVLFCFVLFCFVLFCFVLFCFVCADQLLDRLTINPDKRPTATQLLSHSWFRQPPLPNPLFSMYVTHDNCHSRDALYACC